jgi:hypothetical protein
MQRESNLIATIRKELPDFAKACADDTELVLLHLDALPPTTKRMNTCGERLLEGRCHYSFLSILLHLTPSFVA